MSVGDGSKTSRENAREFSEPLRPLGGIAGTGGAASGYWRGCRGGTAGVAGAGVRVRVRGGDCFLRLHTPFSIIGLAR